MYKEIAQACMLSNNNNYCNNNNNNNNNNNDFNTESTKWVFACTLKAI